MAEMGYPETVEEIFALHNDAPAETNGALDFVEAIRLMELSRVDLSLVPIISAYEWPPPSEPVPVESLAEIDELLHQNVEAIELVAKGVHKESFLYPLTAQSYEPIRTEDFRHWRELARLLSVQALYRVESGDVDGAIDSIETCVLLGNKLIHQPTVIASLVGITVTGIGQANALDVMARGTGMRAGHFERMEELLASIELADSVYPTWCDALMSETWMAAELSSTSWTQPTGAGDVFDAAIGLVDVFVYFQTPVGELDLRDNRRLIYKAALVIRGSGTIEEKQKRIDALDVSEDLLSRYRLLSAFGITSLPGQELFLNPIILTRQHASVTAVRVLKFRFENDRLPTLDEFESDIGPLADPLGEAPLKYKITEDGFRVYGVGRNRIDDGGVSRMDEDAEGDDEVVEVRLGPVGR